MSQWGKVLLTCSLPFLSLAGSPDLRLERTPVSGGAELLTVFGSLSADSASTGLVPLISVLRDTLGDQDPDNDRLRYIWILTSAKPNILRHAAAALPFFYWQPNLGKGADSRPSPVIDMGNTRRNVWADVAERIVQVSALDSFGSVLRTSSRRYRENIGDERRVRLIEGMAVLSELENVPEVKTLLSDPELLEIEARLTLAGQPLGGLVNAKKLPKAYFNQRTHSQEARGHNWEMLRQLAEANGLYFQPLGLGNAYTHALLLVAREDLNPRHPFDGKYLNIANPYTDGRLTNWQGVTVTAYFDENGYRVSSPVPGGSSRELIPLALYGLGYPKLPLLLADFRSTRAPKSREMIRRALTDSIRGVLGISKWTNWPYFAGSTAFEFVENRRGAAFNRAARLETYSETRRWLALDRSMNPALREELLKHLEIMGVNPLDTSVFDEAKTAQHQYAALLRYAQDPNGLPAQLAHDRKAERAAYEHNFGARTGFRMATVFSFGVYRHHDKSTVPLEVALDRRRRADRQLRYLETVLEAGSPADTQEVERTLDELAKSGIAGHGARVVERLIRQTTDSTTRALYQKALDNLNAAGQ
jgi:hypothetical protein